MKNNRSDGQQDRKTSGQEDIRTERQQDRKIKGHKDNRIMWASRAHGMTYDRTERQQN